MQLFTVLDDAAVLKDLQDLGVDSIDEVLSHRTPDAFYRFVSQRAERARGEGAPGEGAPGEGAPGEGAPGEGAPDAREREALRRRCQKAFYQANKLACASRDRISLHDPVAQAMRHYDPGAARLDPDPRAEDAGERQAATRYVRPDSIQSAQSPAAYLKHIYDLAKRTIKNDGSAYALDQRRPDLSELVLSEDNLRQEISTLSLVNEVLTTLLLKQGIASNPEALSRKLAVTLHPFALPFAQDHATVREALGAMSLSLNAVARRGRPRAFALSDPSFTLVPNPGDRLRLYGAHLDLLRALPSESTLYGIWYGGADRRTLRSADRFSAATGLTFTELTALLGQDCDIVDSAGAPPPRAYVEFLAAGYQVSLQPSANRYDILARPNSAAQWFEVPPLVHEIQNKCIRLQRRTGLPFHSLDWLLTAALRSRPGASHQSVWQDGTALNVLAHFLEYRDTLRLTVDQFAALLYQINPLRRSDSAEPSMLTQLFGARAASLLDELHYQTPQVGDLNPTRPRSELGEVLRGGLKVTTVEWLAVAQEVAPDASTGLDATLLARFYRVVTVLRALRWGVLEGLALVKTVDPALLSTLATGADGNEVLGAIDRLLWLAGWMEETAFTPLTLIAAVTPWDASQMVPNQDTINWVVELQQAIQPTLVSPDVLRPYTIWNTASGDTLAISELALLAAIKLYFSNGLVQHTFTSVLGGIIQLSPLYPVLRAFFMAQGVDLSIPANKERFEELFDFLVERENEQAKVLAAQVIKHSETLSDAAVTPVLAWMGTTPFEALKTLMAWNTDKTPAYPQGMTLLLNLRRHLQVVSQLRLDEPEIELISAHPGWLAQGMQTPLSLQQIYLLSRLKRLQNAVVSANDWLAYFGRVRSKTPENSGKMLARLLDWPERDVAELAVCPELGSEDGVVTTVEHADFVARRIDLCRDASLSAGELLALVQLAGDAPNWPAAAQAALAGLKRAQGDGHAAAAQGKIEEELRDALVALTLTTVIPGQPELRDKITDDERLYEYLLLDVKVSSAVPTTKLLEATGSVQLYVNQVLDNVERPQGLDRARLRAAWEVAQQYRIWEANEALILYPSNYIEPELRREKSDLFRKLEQDLTVGDLNEDIIRQALTGFISGLQQLTELRPHGFFCTRDASPMTYFFTARSAHEQHGYYYRRLDLDPERLSDSQPMHALQWGDWKKAAVPVSTPHVYGVVPAFAWNRLFLIWFELEKVTRTHDGKPVDSYYLRPKYSRQNLDGTFTEAQSLTETFDLDVTGDIPQKPVNPTRAEGEEELAPDLYDGPALYQPCYQPGTDSLLVFFKLPGRRPGDRTRSFSWTLKRTSSVLKAEVNIDASTPPHTLYDYASVPHALQLVNMEYLWVQPTEHAVKVSAWKAQGQAYMFLDGDVRVQLQMDPARPGSLSVAFDTQGLSVGGRSDHVSISLWGAPLSYDVRYTLHRVSLTADLHDGNAATVELYRGPLALDVSAKITLQGRLIPLTIPGSAPHGKISMKITCECSVVNQAGEERFDLSYPFESDYSVPEKLISHLYYSKDEAQRPGEYYLLAEVRGYGALVFALGSNAMREVSLLAGSLFDVPSLLRPENQRRAESGVDNFLAQAAGRYGEIMAPHPRSVLDFDGPFGLYAWELFFHIPALVAAHYHNAGRFEEARAWLAAIYDPSADPGDIWRCEPLRASLGRSLSIADPDQLATENPGHYRLATVRQYLRTMTAQGDSYYRQETAESLRQARMWYVAAMRLFTEEMGDALQQATRTEWSNPRLGAASIDFRPPYNQELQSAYATLRERLSNLRDWRGFDGSPLQIPLLAPALNPRELQAAALSGLAASATTSGASTAPLPFTFPEALSKAKEAVRNLMYFGDLLTQGLHRRDEQILAEMRAGLAHHVAAQFERDGQESLINSMEIELKILKKSKEEADKCLEWDERFAKEWMSGWELAAFDMRLIKTGFLALASGAAVIAGGLRSLPNIFGFSVGGSDWGGVPEGMEFAFDKNAEAFDTTADNLIAIAEATRRQQESQKERDVAKLVVERIALEIEQLEYDLGEERGTLEVLKEKAKRTEAIVDFHARRATNKDFHNWYVGRMTSLYNSAFDIALRFCRMAERAYQVDDPKARFINPVWDAQYKGLLSGQGLMLDLQRMDYAFMHRQSATTQGKLRVSLAAVDEQALRALRQSGQAMFSLREELFDEQLPDEHERRIKSVRVRLVGLEGKSDIGGRLALIGDRVRHLRSGEPSTTHVLGRQQISLASAETDTSALPAPEGRLLPFERCGVDSTWILSIPGAVRAIRAKQKTFRQQETLAQLADVVLEVTYTARV